MFNNIQQLYDAYLDELKKAESNINNIETDEKKDLIDEKDDEIKELGRDVLAIDFTSEILAAMDDFPHDRLLHSRVCSSMIKLAKSSESANRRLVLEGGLKIILKYSERHADYAPMQLATCELLRVLAKGNCIFLKLKIFYFTLAGNQSEIVRLGGIRTILRVLEFRESFESADGGDGIYQQAIGTFICVIF